MKAKQVSELLGIERTKLRDYERKFHVFTPENERYEGEAVDYTINDVQKLKRLVLLNQATLTCADIRDVQEGKRTLAQAFKEREKAIMDDMERKIASLKFARMIAETGDDYEALNIDSLWDLLQSRKQKGDEFFMEDDDPHILERNITCPCCNQIILIDLEDCLADTTCNESQHENDMGPDILYEFDPDMPCQCPECNELFSVSGWLREYPLGAYDSDNITTKKYEER